MCEKCFKKEHENFPSSKDFEEFQSDFDQLDETNFQHVRNGNFKFYYNEFECENCNEIWWISKPDNGWRGYCLKKDNAIAYIQKLQKQDQNARIACILLVLFVLIFIVCKL